MLTFVWVGLVIGLIFWDVSPQSKSVVLRLNITFA